ncbi:MAG: hypothetical protein AAFU79_05485, partial [Myxococcota bacterium]
MKGGDATRVLLIEDNRADAVLFAGVADELEEPGVEIETAGTLEGALQRLRSDPFELIVLDIGLP